MTLKEIAIRNLLRRKAKAAFVLVGLAIGVSTVVGVIGFADSMSADINHKLEKFGANILIVPKTENLPLSYGGLSLGGVSFEMEEIRQMELSKIETIKNFKNIAGISPMVLGVVPLGEKKVLLAGMDFSEADIMKPWWKVNGMWPDENGLLVGTQAAQVTGLSTGNTVRLKDRELTVTGFLAPTGSQDDQLIFASLPTAQHILEKQGKVSMVEVAALCEGCPVEEMVAQISAVLPGAKVMAIQQVVKGRMDTLARFKTFSYGVSAVVLLVGSLVVLVTMMGSVRERTQEIGIFRAVGFRKSHLMKIVFIEAGIISALAGVAGYILGAAASAVALHFFIDSHISTVLLDPMMASAAIAMAILIGTVATTYPAMLAARMDPSQALKSL